MSKDHRSEFSERFTEMVYILFDKIIGRLSEEQIAHFVTRLKEQDSLVIYDILKESDFMVEQIQHNGGGGGGLLNAENLEETFSALSSSIRAGAEAIRELAHWEEVNLQKNENKFPLLGSKEGGSPHVVILGKTGSGKSYYTKRLVKYLAKNDRAILIFDRHREYNQVSNDNVQFSTPEFKDPSCIFLDIQPVLDALEMRDMSMGGRVTSDAIGFAANMALRKRIEDTITPHVNEIFGRLKAGNVVSVWLDAPDSSINDEIVKQLLTQLMKKAMSKKSEDIIVVVNEEAQNMLDESGRLHPWVRSISREGRKFGIYLVSISQRPDIGDDVISQSVLYIFKLWPKDIEAAAGNIFRKEMKAEINQLLVGEHLFYDEKTGDWVKNRLNISTLDPSLRIGQ